MVNKSSNKNKVIALFVAGGVMIIAAICCISHGNSLNNNLVNQLSGYLGGESNPGSGWIWFGVILLIAGAVLLIIGFLQLRKSGGISAVSSSNAPTAAVEVKSRDEIDKAIDNLIELKSKGLISDEDFRKRTEQLRQQQPTVQNQETVCSVCGKKLSTTAAFCPNCGSKRGV